MFALAKMYHVSSLPQLLLGGVIETLLQVVYLMVPFIVLGLVLHGLERVVQRSLARHFGWGSILWTGWLGTPVHELSHAALCLVFAHRIEEMALFKPDKKTGMMGYVRHSWNPSNPYAVAGNFFIGVAPLMGGALALFFLLWLFFPDMAMGAASGTGLMEAFSGGDFLGAAWGLIDLVGTVLGTLFLASNVFTWQFWVFLYLVLCVGSHLAPSPADYKGARKGAILLLVLLLVFNWVFLLLGGEGGRLIRQASTLLGPALAVFILAAVLNSFVALLAVSFSGFLDWLRASSTA